MTIAIIGPLSRIQNALRPSPAPAPAPKPAPKPVETYQPRTLISLPGVRQGATLSVKRGVYDGTSFGGRATVRQYDSRNLDLAIKAQVGFFSVDVSLKLAMQPDGSVAFQAGRAGEAPTAAKLRIVSQTPGHTVLAGPDGSQVRLDATQGGLAVTYGQSQIVLG